METKISSLDEKNLTQAIESAATVASVDPSLDRSQLLATHLNKAGVDKRFAKIASSAFNKRLTVLTFQQTDDDHKADSFPLSDGDKVSELMGGTTSKTASYNRSFFIGVEKTATMQKAASAAPVTYGKKPLEYRVDYTDYLDILEGAIDKQAKCFQQINFELRSKEDQLEKLASEIVHDFERSKFGFDFRTAVNYFGNSFTNIIKDKVPTGTNLVKTASAIKLNTPIFAKIAHCIELADYIDATKQFIREYGAGLGQFAKAAYDCSEAIRKAELNGALHKKAASVGLLAGAGMRMIPLGTLGAAEALANVGEAVADAAHAGFTNASNMYNSRDISSAPGKALDAEFLLKDRMHDRMLAWSDMIADPQFAIYPSEQVFQATNKAMNTDTMMERGDKRELLRATVAQLLAQNNRLGSADLAALATTIRGLSSGTGHGAGIAARAVGELNKELPADRVALEQVFNRDSKGILADSIRTLSEGLKDEFKSYTQEASDRRKSEAEKLKEINRAAEANKELKLREDRDAYNKAKDALTFYNKSLSDAISRRDSLSTRINNSVLQAARLQTDLDKALYNYNKDKTAYPYPQHLADRLQELNNDIQNDKQLLTSLNDDVNKIRNTPPPSLP